MQHQQREYSTGDSNRMTKQIDWDSMNSNGKKPNQISIATSQQVQITDQNAFPMQMNSNNQPNYDQHHYI